MATNENARLLDHLQGLRVRVVQGAHDFDKRWIGTEGVIIAPPAWAHPNDMATHVWIRFDPASIMVSGKPLAYDTQAFFFDELEVIEDCAPPASDH